MKTETLANFAAASAALSAGASVVATRLVVAETDPVTLAFYRYVIATICIAPVLIARWPTCSMPMRDTATIASLGALFFGFFPWAFSAALQYSTAARGAIGIATIPIQTLMLAVFLGREVLTSAKLLSVSLAFVGVVVAFGSAAFSLKRPDYLIGDGLMLLGALSAAIYSVLARPVLQRYDALFVTGCGWCSEPWLCSLQQRSPVRSPQCQGSQSTVGSPCCFSGRSGEPCSLGCLCGPCAGCRPSAR
jgi:drug/metabolite transporter (DMT)-like permease